MDIRTSRNLIIAEFMDFPYYYENMHHDYDGLILGVGNIICKTKPKIYENNGLNIIVDEDYTRVPNKWYDQSWDELIPVIQKLREDLPKESVSLDKFIITLGIRNVWNETVNIIEWYNELTD
jgi:hypothetical protein